MNEYYQNTLSNLFNGIIVEGKELYAAGKTNVIKLVEFAEEQVPDLITEIVVYHRAVYTSRLLLAILIPIVYVTILKLINKYDKDGFPTVFFAIFCGGFSILAIIKCLTHFNDFLKVWFAPKLFLIEYMSEIVGKF